MLGFVSTPIHILLCQFNKMFLLRMYLLSMLSKWVNVAYNMFIDYTDYNFFQSYNDVQLTINKNN